MRTRKGKEKISKGERAREAEVGERDGERREVLDAERIFQPVLRALSEGGRDASALKDLTARYAPLPSAAVEILLAWIPKVTDEGAKEMVVRQLAVAAEPFDGRPLVACFNDTTDGSLRWAVLNTIACAMPHSIGNWLDQAKHDVWIEKTLSDLGRRAHGRGFHNYLRDTSSDDGASHQSKAMGKDAAGRYECTYGPVLRKLAEAGFPAHSIEELRQRFAPLPSAAVGILLSCLETLDDRSKPLILQTLRKAEGPFDGRPLAACFDSTYDNLVRDNVLLTIALSKVNAIDGWLDALEPTTKKTLSALRYLA